MKTAGLIAEYNPFHNGHLYHIQQTKELTGAERIVVVMSGDFVQRGAPALFDKYTRTQMALQAGADLVLELPAVFAVSSAEDFAAAATAILDRLGVVDILSFGSELGECSLLSSIADILIGEPGNYTEELKKHLKSGHTFPKARALALLHALASQGRADDPSILESPNNILGIEYLKALKRRDSRILPFTLKREGGGYHDPSLFHSLSSASAIRRALTGEDGITAGRIPSSKPCPSQPDSCGKDRIQNAVPGYVLHAMESSCMISADDLSTLLNYALLSTSEQNGRLEEIADISGDLAGRLRRQSLDFLSFGQRVAKAKTRQYTYTRISRALLHLVLNIKTSDIEDLRSRDYAVCARVLGFRSESSDLMRRIKLRGAIPLITKVADAHKILSPGDMELFRKDLYASHLYQSLVWQKSGMAPKNEYTHGCCIL